MQSLYGWTDRLWRLVIFWDNWTDGWMDLNNRHFDTMFDNIWSIYPSIQVYIHVSIDPIVQKCEKHVVPLGPCAPSALGRCCEGKSALLRRWWSDSEKMRRRSAKMRCCKGEWLILLSLLRLRNFALSPAHFHLRFRYWRIIIGF